MLVTETNIWRGRRVLITGDTGFKGSWLALWLHDLGAQVTGFALPPPTNPSLFERAQIGKLIDHVDGDVRNLDAVKGAFAKAQPEIVFHLAAQPLVRLSYDEPVETYAVNVMGTVHTLEAARGLGSVRAFLGITTDKCYENREWIWPYRETDALGGYDPYSSSKACAELVISAYRRSFFENGLALASVRAGNVIGGGDWATDRLIPDLLGAFERGEAPLIRSPNSVRPWQHVLEALGGYIMIAERLFAGDRQLADAWNFGPSDDDARPVSWIVDRMKEAWGGGVAAEELAYNAAAPHEAGLLRLDCSKARATLGWHPKLPLNEALGWVVDWHKSVVRGDDARTRTLNQIRDYRQRP